MLKKSIPFFAVTVVAVAVVSSPAWGLQTFQYTAGVCDGFRRPDPASPSAALSNAFGPLVGFDTWGADRVFGHTFTGLPACMSACQLTVPLLASSASGANPGNDRLNLEYDSGGGNFAYSQLIAHIPAVNTGWAGGDQRTLALDCSALPKATPQDPNAPPFDLFSVQGFSTGTKLDVLVQDDTAVDCINLSVTNCCGDGKVDPGECCDDGNSTGGDGCDENCECEVCGNNVWQPLAGEECDGTDDKGCPGRCQADCTCRPYHATHLECRRIRDDRALIKELKLKHLTVDLDGPQFGPLKGCVVQKALRFCSPVEKTVTSTWTTLPVDGPLLASDTDYVCYQVKCKRPGLDQGVKDQFADRQMKLNPGGTRELCVPARKTTPCEQTTAPSCWGDCPNDGEFCRAKNGYCKCVTTTTTLLPCDQTYPQCDGECPNQPGLICGPFDLYECQISHISCMSNADCDPANDGPCVYASTICKCQ